MKFYIVVFVDSKNGKVITKGYFESLMEAEVNLKSYAFEFVKMDGGERQEKIALQNGKTIDQIKFDITLTNGLYLQESTSNIIQVLEKSSQSSGYFFSSIASNIANIGMFTITEIDFDVPERFSCGCNLPKTTIKKVEQSKIKGIPFMDELKKLIQETPNISIKPQKKFKHPYKNQQDKPLDFLTDDINKIHNLSF